MVTQRIQDIETESEFGLPGAFFGSRTDVGRIRDHNEDSLLVTPPLFVVADGMGGHAAGEVASEIVVNTLSELAPTSPDPDALTHAIEAANLNVIKAPKQGIGRTGMGTTCTAAILENNRLLVAQVGDSRAYLLHNGRLQQITRDHSLMADLIEAGEITPEQARNHPDRSVITRAIGSDPYLLPDIYELNVENGDRILLCSDGLSGMIYDAAIQEYLRRYRNPQECADKLCEAALDAGGFDNVTVIVVDVQDKSAQQKEVKKVKRHYRALTVCIICAIVAAFALAGYGGYQYVNNSAYLIEENGTVSIYRGIQDEFLGIQLSSLEETTDIPVSQLPPGVANRIKDGLAVGTIDEAQELVAQYRADIAQAELEKAASEVTHSNAGNTSGSSSSNSSSSSSSSRTSNSNSSNSSRDTTENSNSSGGN